MHVLPSLGLGGGERLTIELANQSVADGHEVTVIAAATLPREQTHKGLRDDVAVRFISAQGTPRIKRYLGMFQWLWANRRWLAQQDILHCHMTYPAVLATALQIFSRLTGTWRPAVVETYHAVGMPIPKLHRWIHARMAAQRDGLAFMADNDYWRAFLDKRPHIPVKIIPSGVAPVSLDAVTADQRLAYRRECGIPDECRYVVGTITRLNVHRRPWLYVPVFAAIAERLGCEVHFLLGGDGAEGERVRGLIDELRLTRQVHMLGHVRHIDQLFGITDVYVSLNLGPWTGVAAFQAASAKLPMVGLQLKYGYCANPTDWIWSSSDPEELADRVVALLKSPAARDELAQRQSAYLNEQHSAEAMVRSYYALYDEALARHGRSDEERSA